MIEAGRGLAQCLTLLLNIPIGVVKILVPQIAGQQHQALRDRIGLTAPTADKGGDKGVAKIIEPGTRACAVSWNVIDEVVKSPLCG